MSMRAYTVPRQEHLGMGFRRICNVGLVVRMVQSEER